MKNYIIAVSAAGLITIAFLQGFSPRDPLQVTALLADVAQTQQQCMNDLGHYCSMKATYEGTDYEMHAGVHPDGSHTYQVVIKDGTRTRSFGFGNAAKVSEMQMNQDIDIATTTP